MPPETYEGATALMRIPFLAFSIAKLNGHHGGLKFSRTLRLTSGLHQAIDCEFGGDVIADTYKSSL